jgi:glycosyltransferase involved in cell wall biosynthesis
MTDLQRLLQDDAEISLFKGAGRPGPREYVIRHLKRTGLLSRVLPNRLQYRRYQMEFATFAAALVPHLARSDYDIVHFIDPLLAKPLYQIRKLARRHFKLLFTNGGPALIDCSRWVDHIHVVTPAAQAETRAAGVDNERITLLPVGVDLARFDTPLTRHELRRKLQIPEEVFVILAVTTLNRGHKRVDYLIEEVKQLSGNSLLWVEGGLHPDGDPALRELGSSALGERWRHTEVPSEQVGELFRAADVLVSTALQESFGLAIVEAACVGLPVIVHDSPHFRWLLGNAGHYVNMEQPGALTALLARLMSDRPALQRVVHPECLRKRFGWTELKRDYAALYAQVASGSPRLVAQPAPE